MNIVSGDDALKNVSSGQGLKHRIDIGAWGSRGDGLKPSLFVKTVHPICNARKWGDSVSANQLTIQFLFGIGDFLDACWSRRIPQPLRKD